MSSLTLVPTPVGNLEDMTLRAIRILKESDLIIAEDTRTSGVLLKHYDIRKPLLSFHAHNEHQRVNSIVEKILEGNHVAMITDAGTPGISDPGFLLVRACAEAGIEVSCLPGATAFVPALAVSGLPSDQFLFAGFLPHKKGRQSRIRELAGVKCTMILYESPFRLIKTLTELIPQLGAGRNAAVVREISKIHEEIQRGSLESLLSYFSTKTVKGEIVLIIAGSEYSR